MPKPARCPVAGLNQHRLGERPVLVGLLEHLPGDVPFSTHLEIENVRARLVHQALGEALGKLERGTGHPHRGCAERRNVIADDGPARTETPYREKVRAAEPRVRVGPSERTEYVQLRRRWPIGGLIDLVV